MAKEDLLYDFTKQRYEQKSLTDSRCLHFSAGFKNSGQEHESVLSGTIPDICLFMQMPPPVYDGKSPSGTARKSFFATNHPKQHEKSQ